jgi:hypothetical protein
MHKARIGGNTILTKGTKVTPMQEEQQEELG